MLAMRPRHFRRWKCAVLQERRREAPRSPQLTPSFVSASAARLDIFSCAGATKKKCALGHCGAQRVGVCVVRRRARTNTVCVWALEQWADLSNLNVALASKRRCLCLHASRLPVSKLTNNLLSKRAAALRINIHFLNSPAAARLPPHRSLYSASFSVCRHRELNQTQMTEHNILVYYYCTSSLATVTCGDVSLSHEKMSLLPLKGKQTFQKHGLAGNGIVKTLQSLACMLELMRLFGICSSHWAAFILNI